MAVQAGHFERQVDRKRCRSALRRRPAMTLAGPMGERLLSHACRRVEGVRHAALDDATIGCACFLLSAAGALLACRNLPFLAVFHVPGLWLLTDMKKMLEEIVRA